MDFDSAVVSYEELLQLFWQSHDPVRPAFKTQYASLVLAHDTAQLASARHSARGLEAVLSRRLATRIEMLNRFWLAEDYHQKYYLRQDRAAMVEFRTAFGGDEDSLRESPAAARANALLAAGRDPGVLLRHATPDVSAAF